MTAGGTDPPTGAFPVIALVCSAGGLNALIRVLSPLPASLPAAVIALQHLSPNHDSELAALLDRRTALRVTPARDGEPIACGHVLVAPPAQHTLVTADASIALIRSGALPLYRPSADLLLTSLALTLGPRAIAVVLSGQGNDAATGATAVHRFGGVVIASSPQTSTQPAMPNATINRENIIDHVVPLDEVAGLLISLANARLKDPV